MIKIKLGFIARVATNGYDPLPKAPVISEGCKYPELRIIEPKRAVDFFSRIVQKRQDIIRGILFSKEQWQEIVKSFDGHEPEVDTIDPGSIAQVFDWIPKNLRIKLRVMLDENGNQVKEADLIEQIKTTQDILVERVETQAEAWKKSQREKFKDLNDWRKIEPQHGKVCVICGAPAEYFELDLSGYKCKNCSNISKSEKQREQMIQRLVDNERNNVLACVSEYEQRIRQMSDDQIEKEYRMEFGE